MHIDGDYEACASASLSVGISMISWWKGVLDAEIWMLIEYPKPQKDQVKESAVMGFALNSISWGSRMGFRKSL